MWAWRQMSVGLARVLLGACAALPCVVDAAEQEAAPRIGVDVLVVRVRDSEPWKPELPSAPVGTRDPVATTRVVERARIERMFADEEGAEVVRRTSDSTRNGGLLSIRTAVPAPTPLGSTGPWTCRPQIDSPVSPEYHIVRTTILDADAIELEIRPRDAADGATPWSTVRLARGQSAVIEYPGDLVLEPRELRIPVLSAIPLIGAMFRTTSIEMFETRIMVTVTPYLVSASSTGLGPADPIRSGRGGGGA